MKRWFVLGLAAVVAPMLVGSSSCGSNTGTVVSSGTSTGGRAASQTAKVGDRIKIGDKNFFFTVTGVQTSAGTDFEKPSKGQYLIVSVTFDNQSGAVENVSSAISFELRDGTGQSYTETILTTAPKPPDGEIANNDKLAGGLTYDVPKGQTFRLYYKNDVFASGAVVVDLGQH